MLTSGPPELPGLIEASVCRKSVNSRSPRSEGTVRPTAESTPVVTVFDRPNGLPMATTVSPIIRSELCPRGTAGRPLAFTLSTAMSASRSEPSRSASISRPSSRVTVIREAPSMTWALVTTMPLRSTMNPEPSDWAWRSVPRPKRPKNGSASRTVDSAEMLTTAGATFSTSATTGVRRAACGVWAAARPGRSKDQGKGGKRGSATHDR